MIALGSDHAGLPLKKEIMALLDEMQLPYHDYGTYTADSCDYAVFAQRAAKAVVGGECERGILCCGTGIGISIAANKVKGIRCCACSDCYSAKMSRAHNDANMLALGARVVGTELGRMIAQTFLTSEFEGGRISAASIRLRPSRTGRIWADEHSGFWRKARRILRRRDSARDRCCGGAGRRARRCAGGRI